jgi:hypothetical protein
MFRSGFYRGYPNTPPAAQPAPVPIKGAVLNKHGGVTLCQNGHEESTFGFAGRLFALAQPAPAQPEQEPVAHLWKCLGRWSAYLASNGEQADCAPPSWLVEAVRDATPPAAAHVQHPDDAAVDRFAQAMKEKMAKQREKGYSGWDNSEQCPTERLQTMLSIHVAKGDPVDVGNFAMMLWNRCETTTPPAAPVPQDPMQHHITPLMEQQMFDDWCPYKGSPDPRTVWSAAIDSANGLLLAASATPPAAAQPAQELYHELLFAVAKVHPNETRHQTALRYILQAESGGTDQCTAAHGIKENT